MKWRNDDIVNRPGPGGDSTRLGVHYDRAHKNLDRHPNYILAAYMASGT
jgi:hypothetical protein